MSASNCILTLRSPSPRVRKRTALLPLVLLSCAVFLWGQSAKDKSVASLAEPLNNPSVDLHVFYVHGMGINPPDFKNPQDFETSQEFRKSFCKRVHRTNDSGSTARYYAMRGLFDPNKSGPDLFYLGHRSGRWTRTPHRKIGTPPLLLSITTNLRADMAPPHLSPRDQLVAARLCRKVPPDYRPRRRLAGPDDKHTCCLLAAR